MAESQYIADSAHDPHPLLKDVYPVPLGGVPPMDLDSVGMALVAGIATLSPRGSCIVINHSFRS